MSICEVFDRFRRAAPLDEDRSYILAVLLGYNGAADRLVLDASMAFWTLMVHM